MDYIDNCPIGKYSCIGCNYLSTWGCSHPNKYKQKENFIEIPFGARDSETLGWEYTIPNDMEATIQDGKIIVRKKESEDEKARKYLLHCVEEWEEGHCCWNSNKEAIKPLKAYLEKQKPAWSEEDENRFKNLYDVIDKCDWNTASKEGFKKFLKSLKPQPKWIPSEEQIQALEYQVNSPYIGSWQYKASKELLEQLKKLKEE